MPAVKRAPLPANETERLAAVRHYGVLDTLPEAPFDDLTRLAAQICQAPIALITFVDEHRLWIKSNVGFRAREMPRPAAFCSYAILQPGLMMVKDPTADSRFTHHPWVTGQENIRFYAGMPVVTPEGFALGTLNVMDHVPRVITGEQAEALQVLSRQVMTQIELRSKVIELDQTVRDQQKTWEALQTSEAFYHSLVENLPQNIFRKDLEGRFTFANQRFCDTVGKPLEEVMGKTDFDLFPPELAHKYHQDDLRIIQTHQPLETVEENQMPDQGVRYVQVVKTPLVDHDNRVIGVQGIFWDVTERKKIEEDLAHERDLLRVMLDNVPDRIYFKDKQSRFLKGSKALAEIFGRSDPEELTGKTDFDFFTEEHARAAFEDEQQIVRTGQPLIGISEKETWQDGQERWVLTTKMPMRNKEGEVVGTFGISKDITPLKAAEDAMAKARDEALESARLKSEFLANMSHEIRTPMNAIIGMTGLLLDTPLTQEQRDFAETVRASADALLTIINDILDFSKIEAGKVIFEEVDFDLHEAVEGTVELLAERAQRKGIEMAVWIEESAPAALRGDPGRLRQVLTNLIGNAVKFTTEGEVVVRVKQEEETDHELTLRFSVSDTGIGIDPKALPLIFQAFIQGDGSMTRRYGGTGLGLAISRQLVEMMKGRIQVESIPGKGSIFQFTATFQKQPVQKTKREEDRASLAGTRVLLVDDNATNRKILSHHLGSWRMKCHAVADGYQALRQLQRAAAAGNPFELVVLDMQMPEMDGLTLAKRIQADPKLAHIPRVMLTSMGHRLETAVMRSAGISHCLLKPVKQSRLYDTLATVLASPADRTLASDTARSKHAERAKTLPARFPKGIRILVAEDNIVNQKVAVRQLQKLGLSADAVANGLEVMEAVNRIPYDIILMDCQMPEMDGYETTRKLRQREKQRHARRQFVIAMTANALEGDREKCLNAGMDDYISKPVQLSELQSALVRAVDQYPAPSLPAPAHEPAEVLDPQILQGLRDLQEGDEPDPLIELIDLFLADAPKRLEKIHQAVHHADAAHVVGPAHSLKGSAGNLGARRLSKLCAQLEKQARGGNLREAPDLIQKIDSELNRVWEALLAEKNK